MSDCAHPSIVESTRYPDGSIDGRCEACGEDGFPIRDVAYEEWMASGDAPKCGVVPGTYQQLLAKLDEASIVPAEELRRRREEAER